MTAITEEEISPPTRTRNMDLIDRKILDLLQADATLSIAEIADRVGLSQT
ncbi:MAG TPA: AsnC family protein, partial [Microvirga sp.]|nr:AsnC family protein [Microvirga sp.]